MRVNFPSFTPVRGTVLVIELFFFIKFAFRLSFALKELLLQHCSNCFVFCLSLFPPCKDIRPFRC